MKRIVSCVMPSIITVFIIITSDISAKEVIEFGNTVCPVSGEKLIEETVVKYEYEGVTYNLCCKMCLKDFKKNPEKYIKKLEAEKEKSEAVEAHAGHHH